MTRKFLIASAIGLLAIGAGAFVLVSSGSEAGNASEAHAMDTNATDSPSPGDARPEENDLGGGKVAKLGDGQGKPAGEATTDQGDPASNAEDHNLDAPGAGDGPAQGGETGNSPGDPEAPALEPADDNAAGNDPASDPANPDDADASGEGGDAPYVPIDPGIICAITGACDDEDPAKPTVPINPDIACHVLENCDDEPNVPLDPDIACHILDNCDDEPKQPVGPLNPNLVCHILGNCEENDDAAGGVLIERECILNGCEVPAEEDQDKPPVILKVRD